MDTWTLKLTKQNIFLNTWRKMIKGVKSKPTSSKTLFLLNLKLSKLIDFIYKQMSSKLLQLLS